MSIVAGAVGIATISNARPYSMSQRRFDRLFMAAFLASRLALYFGVFFVLRIPARGDIPSFYWDQGVQVLQGLLPYRDFPSSYAPLHPFLDAAILRVWPSPLAMILFALLVECLVVPLWLHLGRSLFREREVRAAALLYLTSAISLQFVTIDGQDNVVLAGLFGLAILLLLRNRPMLSGIAVGLGATLIKFLPLVYAPLYFVAAPRRWRWAAGLTLPVALVYGGFAVKHLAVLSVITNEGGLRSANNITYLVEALFGVTVPSGYWDGLMAVAFLATFLLVAYAATRASLTRRLHAIIFGTVAVTLILLLFAKKSWPPYLMFALFPMCLMVSVGSKLKPIAFAIFGVIALIAPSYWATVLSQFSAQEFHAGLLAGDANCYVFLVLQTLLVVGYGWLLITSILAVVQRDRRHAKTEDLTKN